MGEPLRPKLQPEHAGTLLEVEDLHVHFLTSRGVVRAVEVLRGLWVVRVPRPAPGRP